MVGSSRTPCSCGRARRRPASLGPGLWVTKTPVRQDYLFLLSRHHPRRLGSKQYGGSVGQHLGGVSHGRRIPARRLFRREEPRCKGSSRRVGVAAAFGGQTGLVTRGSWDRSPIAEPPSPTDETRTRSSCKHNHGRRVVDLVNELPVESPARRRSSQTGAWARADRRPLDPSTGQR